MQGVLARIGKPKYEYQRIAVSLAEAVSKGYRPGDILDSESKLAKQYSVTTATLRRALDILSSEGIVERYHGRGTVVADRLKQGEIAIIMRPSFMETGSSHSYREAAHFLSEKISQHNNNWFPKLHLGGKTDTGQNYPATLDLLSPNVIKQLLGVFTFHPLYEVGKSLTQNNIPIVSLAYYGEADAFINLDNDSYLEKLLPYLRSIGYRTVGFLWHHSERSLEPQEREDVFFARHVALNGLSTQKKWMPAVIGDVTESKGYERFIEFWEQGDHPDAIVVNDDIMACGALRAILHKQIRVPEQLRFATFAIKGSPIPYHVPVTRYEYDMEAIATEAVDAMVKLVNGQELEQERLLIPGQLVKGETA